MNKIVALSIICILIEICHVAFYNYIRPIMRKINYMYKQSKKQENTITAIEEFRAAIEKDAVLQESVFGALDVTPQVLDIMNGFLSCMRNPRAARHKYIELAGITTRDMGAYLMEFIMDLVYWIISIVLVFIMPGFSGLIIFLVLMVLSKLDSINDKRLTEGKEAVKYYYLADALICITMFIVVIMFYR